MHLFFAMIYGTGVVVVHEEVDEKSNEITALRPLLEPLDITGSSPQMRSTVRTTTPISWPRRSTPR